MDIKTISPKKLVKAKESKISNALIVDSLEGVNLSGRYFENCTFQDIKISACLFRQAIFANCSFHSCDIECVDFIECTFNDCTFSSRFEMCDLSLAHFNNSRFNNGYISHCKLNETVFSNIVFDGIWAGNLILMRGFPVKFDCCSYTMGGATNSEIEKQKELFFNAFKK